LLEFIIPLLVKIKYPKTTTQPKHDSDSNIEKKPLFILYENISRNTLARFLPSE